MFLESSVVASVARVCGSKWTAHVSSFKTLSHGARDDSLAIVSMMMWTLTNKIQCQSCLHYGDFFGTDNECVNTKKILRLTSYLIGVIGYNDLTTYTPNAGTLLLI